MDDDKKTKLAEFAAAAVRATFGALGAVDPHLALVAPLISEVVTSIIPRQRVERIEHLTAELATQVSSMDEEKVKQRFGEPGFVDLLEDGLWQATRATSEERIKQIATLLKNGLSNEDVNALQYKTLMGLLGQLNDAEIIMLQSLALIDNRERQALYEKQPNVLMPVPAYMGSPREDVDKNAIHDNYRAHLRRLGLAKFRYREPKRGEMPEIDYKTRMVKSSSTDATWLGRYLLRVIGLEEDKSQNAEQPATLPY